MNTKIRNPITQILKRTSNPAILPITPTTYGNNVPKSLHKTRRAWKTNVTRMDWPISFLDGSGFSSSSLASTSTSAAGSSMKSVGGGNERGLRKLRGIKIQMRDVRSVEKAGGIEGVLLSRPGKQLTPFGQKLRAALFADLHRWKSQKELTEGGEASVEEILSSSIPPSTLSKPI